MINRIINWRARVNGINWWEGPVKMQHPAENGGEPLTREEESYLVALEREMAKEARLARELPVVPGDQLARVGIHPTPPRAGFPVKATAYVLLAVFAAVGAWDMAERGQVLPCFGFVVLAWVASKWSVEAYPGGHGQ